MRWKRSRSLMIDFHIVAGKVPTSMNVVWLTIYLHLSSTSSPDEPQIISSARNKKKIWRRGADRIRSLIFLKVIVHFFKNRIMFPLMMSLKDHHFACLTKDDIEKDKPSTKIHKGHPLFSISLMNFITSTRLNWWFRRPMRSIWWRGSWMSLLPIAGHVKVKGLLWGRYADPWNMSIVCVNSPRKLFWPMMVIRLGDCQVSAAFIDFKSILLKFQTHGPLMNIYRRGLEEALETS